jgi:excisionase family DNA binding protein
MTSMGKRPPEVAVEFSQPKGLPSKETVGLTPALKDFIDSVIVPILVKKYLEESRRGGVVASTPDKGMPKGKSRYADNMPIVDEREPLLTAEEVAERLKIKASTVYELTRRRSRQPLPFLKIGKYLRFRWSEVEKWLESCRGVAAR